MPNRNSVYSWQQTYFHHRSPLNGLTYSNMEFPIRFPAPYLITGPAPYISSRPVPFLSAGSAPYISSYPSPYIDYSRSPYASTGPAPYISDSTCDTSDLAMDTSQELSMVDEEEYREEKEDASVNDSGISCSDDSESGPSPGGKVRGSRKRKSFVPCRTMRENDPDFRGVTVTMENKFVDSEWKLVMHSTFSLPPKKKRKFRPYVDSSDEEDINNNFTPITEEKHCASCSVKKTPLWRDAEDGTPLCNACGIRYKKYKLRCGTCWHIPKKDEFRPTCQYCGSFYEYIYPRR